MLVQFELLNASFTLKTNTSLGHLIIGVLTKTWVRNSELQNEEFSRNEFLVMEFFIFGERVSLVSIEC